MVNQNLTQLVFLLDRSGSMQSIRTDVIGGFDAFLTEQRSSEGECLVTLAQFDNEYEVVYQSIPLNEVPALDIGAARRNCTARFDGQAHHRHRRRDQRAGRRRHAQARSSSRS